MIEFVHGDLLSADVDALVNAVNCVGVMGKGLALQFKKAYPEAFRAYRSACRAGEIAPQPVARRGRDGHARAEVRHPPPDALLARCLAAQSTVSANSANKINMRSSVKHPE